MNEILKKLYYWYTVEKFSEFSIENKSGLRLTNSLWDNKKEKCNYRIYIGLYNNQIITNYMMKKWGDKEKLPESISHGIACLCIINVNEHGQYIQNTLKIPSIHYAISELANGMIKSESMSDKFYRFIDELENVAIAVFKHINDEAIDKFISILLKYYTWFDKEWIYKEVKYNIEEIKQNIDSNEEAYFNSFYLKDIEMLLDEVKNENYGIAFKNFVGQDTNIEKIDIENDKQEIDELLQPLNIPEGRWPSEYPLSLMQQIAVNVSNGNLIETQGIFSVNGPPGTGKTTLLRDIISEIVVNRAKILCKYDNPQDAFTKSQDEIKIVMRNGKEYVYHPYVIDKCLRNSGITVVSNNNNAVENISKELPELGVIGKFADLQEGDYFRDISDEVCGFKTWGLISVALGNKGNCDKFLSKFWNNGFSKFAKILNPNKTKNKDIIGEEYKVDWNEEKRKFEKLYKEILFDKLELNNVRKAIKENKYLDEEIHILKNDIENIDQIIKSLINKNDEINKNIYNVKERLSILNELISNIRKPNIFIRIFKRNIYEDYLKKIQEKTIIKEKYLNENLEYHTLLKYNEQLIIKEQEKKNKLNDEYKIKNTKYMENLKIIEKNKEKNSGINSEEFWNMPEEKQQIESLWISKELNKKRCELFLKALQLHKAFILNAKKEFENNLTILMNYLSNTEMKGNYIENISNSWNTLFMVIPVVSSSFASIRSMYRHLGREEIGWLMIDEAGQALPQNALGAIWRSRRVIVVGDPLQVEPVFPLPLSILEVIGKEINVDDSIVSKTLSVQTMADNVNKYGTNRNGLWIGSPLRVHRRCKNPMFSISNQIAYDNKMIYGTGDDKENIANESKWINCIGKSDGGKSHYIKEEGDIIYDLIKNNVVAGKLPNVYIISPFKTVANGIKRRLKSINTDVEINENELKNWLRKSIGTVHTFQGKEQDKVILCLGVDDEHEGAVNWASDKPNILNVAVTRAKKSLIIVGNKKLWGGKPYFKEALMAIEDKE